jgi:hypothetical protein
MRAEKREFAWEFSQLSCPVQTRTRVAWELMRVEKREFAWEFSQLSCLGQTRTRVAWELMRVCMRVFSTFMAWSNDNKSCMRVEKGEFAWEFSQLLYCPGQWTTRVACELTSDSLHESWLDVTTRSKNSYIWTFVKIWTSLKFMRDESQTRPRATTLINSHPSFNGALKLNRV